MQLFTAGLLHKVRINATLIYGVVLPCRGLLVCPSQKRSWFVRHESS